MGRARLFKIKIIGKNMKKFTKIVKNIESNIKICYNNNELINIQEDKKMTEWVQQQEELIEEVLKFDENFEKLKTPPTKEELKSIREKCSQILLFKFQINSNVSDNDLLNQIESFAKSFLAEDTEEAFAQNNFGGKILHAKQIA